MECITTVSYLVMINGKPTTPFQARKGLRQGDPLSSFIFALGMEYLSRSLDSLDKQSKFGYHPRCKKVKLTHLMFAYDVLLFCRVDAKSVALIMEKFQEFSKCSRLEVNVAKFEVFF